MTARIVVWITIGIAAGATHAAALWRSTHQPTSPSWSAMWRLPLLGAVLATAAVGHALLAAVIGWTIGLTTGCLLYLSRTRRWK